MSPLSGLRSALSVTGISNTRDWTLTTVWTLSIDAVAAGLMAMVFSSYVMWFCLKPKVPLARPYVGPLI